MKRRIGDVTSIDFSSDGRRIVSGSSDKALLLWPVLEGWADDLCAKLSRNLSKAEWRAWISRDIHYVKQCPNLPIPPDEPAASPVKH